MACHNDQIDLFFIDKLQNFLGRIADGNMLNVQWTPFQILSANLIEAFFGRFTRVNERIDSKMPSSDYPLPKISLF